MKVDWWWVKNVGFPTFRNIVIVLVLLWVWGWSCNKTLTRLGYPPVGDDSSVVDTMVHIPVFKEALYAFVCWDGEWHFAKVSDTVVWDGDTLVHPKFERGSVYWERRYPDTVYHPWGSHPDSCDTFYVTERR